MNKLQPSANTTCFRLRTAPLGFDSAPPWKTVSAVPAADIATPAAAVAAPPPPPPALARRRPRWLGLAAFALLAVYGWLAWTASLHKGQSFDEGLQLAVGYNLWINGDYRMEGANGDFVKRWATLPFLLTRPAFVDRDDRFWKLGAPYELAHRFFFQLGNRPESLLQQGRAMIVLLGIATGLLVFAWSRSLFGPAGALVSLGLFAFSPHMLAFGAIVSTDMSITLLLPAATWCVWRLLHALTWPRLLASLVVFGLLVLAKPSALVILPITAVLVAVRLAHGGPLLVGLGRERMVAGRGAQAALFAGCVALHALAGLGAVWSHYGFRHAASPDAADPSIQLHGLSYRDGVSEPLRRTLAWMHASRVVPEGFYHGVHQLAGNDDEIVSFLDGEWTVGGRADFFPYAIWVKTSPPLFTLLAASAAVIFWIRRRDRRGTAPRAAARPAPSWHALAPLFALIGCYLAIALTEDLNIGHRHILPIYPALHVLAGGVGLAALRLGRAARVGLLSAALAWPLAESLAARPDYLAYFGPQAGGTDEGYRRLVDSSLDWGMDLPALREWLDERQAPGSKVFLAYFGTDSPTHHGIAARRLPGFYDRRPVELYPLEPGCYAISATLLQSVYTAAVGPWSRAYEASYRRSLRNVQRFERSAASAKPGAVRRALETDPWRREIIAYDALRFARLCAWLRHRRTPDARAGQSILIWNLGAAELREALYGAPVELTNDPMPARQYGRKVSAWR